MKKATAGPASTVKKPEAVAPNHGFSLGASPVGLGFDASFSLDGKRTRTSPITAPLPDPATRLPGEPLSVQEEAHQEFAELQGQFQDKKLTSAEFYQKKARENWRRDLVSETTYWAALVFANTEDLNTFLTQLNVPITEQFLDGYVVAERLGYDVPRTALPEPRMSPLEMWADLALTVTPPPEASVPEGFDPDFE